VVSNILPSQKFQKTREISDGKKFDNLVSKTTCSYFSGRIVDGKSILP